MILTSCNKKHLASKTFFSYHLSYFHRCRMPTQGYSNYAMYALVQIEANDRNVSCEIDGWRASKRIQLFEISVK